MQYLAEAEYTAVRGLILKVGWSATEIEVLKSLLDTIIPPNSKKNIPGAGMKGVIEFLFKESVSDNSLEKDFKSLIVQAESLENIDVNDRIRVLEKDQCVAFSKLIRAVYMGYYSRPEIRLVLGLSERPVQPEGYLVETETQQEILDLTSSVRTRGKTYRDPIIKSSQSIL